jgi:thymidylate kinase
LLHVPLAVSEERRLSRQAKLLDVPAPEAVGTQPKLQFVEPLRDRMEEADRAFFERVQQGFEVIAAEEPGRVRVIDATRSIEAVADLIWQQVSGLLRRRGIAVRT